MRLGIRSSLNLAASWVLVALSTACGQSDGMVSVRLFPAGLGATRPLDLAKNLASPSRAYVGKCTQRNLVAGVDPTPESDGESLLETVRIPIQTEYDSANDYTIDSSWMLTYANPINVELRVPKGSPVAIGILGTLVSARSAFNGFCDEINPGTQNPYPGSSVLGYRTQVFNEPQDLVIPVWIVPARTGFAPRAPTAAGNPGCDTKGTSEFCPEKAFLGTECAYCPMAPNHHLRITYAFDRNGKPPVTQFLPAATFSGGGVYTHIPDILPMRIEVLATQAGILTPITGFTWDVQRSAFQSGGTNGQRWATQSYGPNGVTAPSGESLKLVEYPRKLPPTIGAFTLSATPASGTTFPITWSSASNATYYEIYDSLSNLYGTTSGNSFSINVSTFNGGNSYTFLVKAYNNEGSTPVQSNAVVYTHIKWMPLPTSSVGPSGGMFTVLNGLAAGGATHNLICNRTMGTGTVNLNFPITNATQTISGGLTSGDQYNCFIQSTNAAFGSATSTPFPATVL